MSDDYIKRSDAIKTVCGDCEYYATNDCEDCRLHRLTKIPAADVRPVKEGEWVREMWFRTCSECGATTTDKDDEGEEIPDNFCPNCGAKMGGTP